MNKQAPNCLYSFFINFNTLMLWPCDIQHCHQAILVIDFTSLSAEPEMRERLIACHKHEYSDTTGAHHDTAFFFSFWDGL